MKLIVIILSFLVASVSAFTPSVVSTKALATTSCSSSSKLNAVIVEGVEFDTIAREWRCKWSGDNDKKSLIELQKVLSKYLPKIKAIDGVTNVERIVCGGCLDFKVITSLSESTFGSWAESEFSPESDFIKDLESIDGVSLIETQTYTKVPV